MATTNHQDDLELSLLRTFLAVVRFGSMGRAAIAVCRTQPAVSQQMVRLERIIGQKVFSRTRGGVKLTRHGEMLLPYANRALEINDDALARLRGQSPPGPVRLGISEDTALAGLTAALKRFQSSHPEVSLEIVVAGPAKLDRLLTKKEIDFAICDPNSVSAALVTEWNTSPAWFASAALTIDPLRALPLVLWHSSGSWQSGILGSLRSSGWEWRVVFESASFDTTLAAVESGLGVSAFLRESVRNAAIAEIKNITLPALPQVRLALFRSSAAASGAPSPIESALATALVAESGNGSTLFNYPRAFLPVEAVYSRIA